MVYDAISQVHNDQGDRPSSAHPVRCTYRSSSLFMIGCETGESEREKTEREERKRDTEGERERGGRERKG